MGRAGFGIFAVLITALWAAAGMGASTHVPAPVRSDTVAWHLTDRSLFARLAGTMPSKAYRLEAPPESMSLGRAAVPASYRRAAELHGRPPRVLSRLLRMLAGCPWVHTGGWTAPTPPSLALHWGSTGSDSLGVDMLISLQSRTATLHRAGEGTLAAEVAESLRTDLAWCLWALDSENPESRPVVESEMLRRGLVPANAPPPDIEFLRGFTPGLPDVSGRESYDQPAEPVSQVQPVYPEMAKEAQIEGTVLLRVFVGPDGRVKDMRTVRSVKYLDASARDAVRRWIYKPALLRGEPVAVWIDVPVEFKLP